MNKKRWLALGVSLSLLATPTVAFEKHVFANSAEEEVIDQDQVLEQDESSQQLPPQEIVSKIVPYFTNTSYKKSEFTIFLKLPEDVDQSTINTNTIHIRNLNIGDDQTADSPIKLTIDMSSKTVTIKLKEDLDQNAEYTLIVDGVKSESGVAYEEVRKSFQTNEQQEEEVTELAQVQELTGEAISPTAIKWTWKYNKTDEKKIDGFRIYDEDGDLLTDDDDLNAKDRQFIQNGLKPGKKYSISIVAFKVTDDDEEEVIESEKLTAAATTKQLVMPAMSEKALIAKVSGYNIQYYWEYKNYQDYKQNFTDYEIQIADDKDFTKNVIKAPLIKGNVLHKNALKNRSTKNAMKLTKYFRIVNKAHNIKSNPTKKTIFVNPAVSPKAPSVTIAEAKDGYVIVQIKDLSTNEAAFRLYYLDKYGEKYFLTTVTSKSMKSTGDVYPVRVYWLDLKEFHGFKATAVDKNGIEGKESDMAIFSEAGDEGEEVDE
ncbi:MAG: fibronectin type III domain-containing protein [Anoxybacillus sp.]|nr:fibronectin type III domain-containing protein [Anoxybacillus sp.]MCL6586218.1 fibronectin type III domain-containing protein [Anoxybacillus sp.]